MNCPSCNRNLASTLSICPSCGTMVYDSVREELALKISTGVKITPIETKEKPVISITSELPSAIVEAPVAIKNTLAAESVELVEPIVSKPAVKKPQTAPLPVRPTSPTLVDFNNKNAALPEWRLQMQNAVVKRRGGRENPVTTALPAKPQTAVSRSRQTNLTTQGATALKVETETTSASPAVELSHLERALMRIEESRQKFLVESPKPVTETINQSSVKQFPATSFSANRKSDVLSGNNQSQSVVKFTAKPNPASAAELKAEKFDTNKLPPLPAKISSSFESRPVIYADLNDIEDENFIRKAMETAPDAESVIEVQTEEDIDDCAPLSLRFNAAIFDLLIGAFASLILLSPFMLLKENFFSGEGFLAFLAICAIVMFAYMTLSIGFLGRTFGMKLFSLEIVDIDENAYPTIHQAAVSSSLYLVSLALGGLGFLTLLLNNEKRAAHDLLSGTIIVKEYQ